MADLYVRNLVRSWLVSGVVPYYDTVNIEQDPEEDLWCTVDWGFSFPSLMTYCGEVQHEGSFRVLYFGLPGIGDQAVLAAAEIDMASLMSQMDPNKQLALIGISSAEDVLEENYFGVAYSVDYEYTR